MDDIVFAGNRALYLILMSGWYGEKLYSFGIEMLNLAFARG